MDPPFMVNRIGEVQSLSLAAHRRISYPGACHMSCAPFPLFRGMWRGFCCAFPPLLPTRPWIGTNFKIGMSNDWRPDWHVE